MCTSRQAHKNLRTTEKWKYMINIYYFCMSLKSNIIDEGDYLNVEISGKFEFDEAVALLEQVRNRCIDDNFKKIILDVLDVDFTTFETMQRFNIGEKMAELFIDPIVKIAVVLNLANVDTFPKLVARNRFAYIESFEDKSKAIEWLKD